MNRKIVFAILLACVYSTDANAPSIPKCKHDDSKCLKETTRGLIPEFCKGIPSLGVESLDPLLIKTLDASSPSLKLQLKDVTAKGMMGCVPKKVQRDKASSKLFVTLLCTVDLEGQYEMSGKILLLPIEGKGKAHVVLRKILIAVEVLLGEKVGSDGVKHWTIKNWTHTYELKDKSTVELDNLYNGNEVLGRAAREILTTSANDIVLEVGPPIVKGVASKIVKNVNNFFSNVPAEDLEI